MIRRSTLTLALLLVGLAACRAPRETRFLNFDAESSSGALERGWSTFERNGNGDTFVWAIEPHATLLIQSEADGDRLIRFRAWPFPWEGAPRQTLALSIERQQVAQLDLVEGAQVYSVQAPRSLFHRGIDRIDLDFDHVAPAGRQPSSDQRSLAVCFDWLEIVPLPSVTAQSYK